IGGRPAIDFDKSSERSKRRKTKKLRSQSSSSELLYTAQMNFRSSGQLVAAKILKDITSSPKKASKYRKAYKSNLCLITSLSEDKALLMIIKAKLSKHKCNSTTEIYSFTIQVRSAFICCLSSNFLGEYPGRPYPYGTDTTPENITITETSAEVNLQSSLNHTVQRILFVKAGKGILPRAMTLNNNKIEYVHWNDPNELVDRLRLLDTSRRTGNNAHDNEIMSIIEELRKDGLIIN
ncbi:uncharacterized protein, partial [Anoplolepis gracilipes]|uniref:uncharacterized protein n=1 Tax=Anoplolepis gracilipes TaxID=354296 RepID=UPI003BA051CC